ncbi:MAG TPA: SpoIIE family protein phosphatase, partial [Planctomycetota bacterium]|nr:SpoIIE family protein phosphatase [Planctomycetota bacterium]
MSPPRAASAEKTERTSDPDLHERSRRGGSSAEVAVAAPGGLTLTWAFVLSVGAAVALATLAASVLNYALAMRAADQALDIAGSSAALNAAAESGVKWDPQGNASTFRDVQVQPAQISRRGQVVSGVVYRASRRELNGTVSSFDVVIDGAGDDFRQALLLSLVLSSVVVVGVGIGVAFLISRRVVAPVAALIEDIRVLSHGNLDHRVRVQAGGELGLLAKSVDRMIRGLRDAREAEREREQQEHELALASEIRSSLLPEGVPALPGYEIAAHGAAADSVGGDLFDYVPNAGGGSRFGVFVAGISARGVPGAMLMTMARAYLHDAAERYPSPSEALKAANRPITRDMRRGLFVTAIAAVLEPETGRVLVASAGHKAPLLHWVAA